MKIFKKINIIWLLLFSTTGVLGQGIDFHHASFNDVLKKAKEENKLVFVDCYTDWCGPCKMLSNKIFPQKEVGDYFNAHFVSTKIDMEKGEGPQLLKKYGVKAFPTLLFLNADAEIVHKVVGGLEVQALIAEATIALDPSKQIMAVEKKYSEGNREPALVAKYVTMLYKQYEIEKANKIANDYLNTIDAETLAVKENFEIASTVGLDYGSEKYNYVKNNQEKLKKFNLEKTPDLLLYEAHLNYLSDLAEKTNDINELQKAIESFEVEYKDKENSFRAITEFYKTFYLSNKQYDKWFEITEKSIEEEISKDRDMGINIIINTVYQLAMNPKFEKVDGAYDWGIRMINRSLELENTHPTPYYCLALLYKKKDDKTEAVKNVKLFEQKMIDKGIVIDARGKKFIEDIKNM